MHLATLRELLDDQAGIVSRRQLVEGGATESDLRRWLRRRELVSVHPGVYVNHTGPLTWVNRAWAAVLAAWPAALAGPSAVGLAGEPIHVAVAVGRTLVRRPGIRLHWLMDLDNRVQWNRSPPRVRFEDALLTVCADSSDRIDALAAAVDACRRRRTTPSRLAEELGRRPNVQHRAWLLAVLDEAAQGVHSVLESIYLRRVERRHGLPRGRRQVRSQTAQGVVYHDVRYDRFGVLIELDGRVGHELSRERWDDMDRDLEAATQDLVTLRVGWRQAEEEPCQTAGRVAAVLTLRGWQGRVRRCGPDCTADHLR